MSLKEKNYKKRLIDDKIDEYLKVFGAISIEGPKWCGKTWTSLSHAESVTYMTEPDNKALARINPKNIFSEKKPQLIDEWQIVPEIWDSVRHECDMDTNKGKFILTGSTTLRREKLAKEVFHSGAGRFIRLRMHTMSLYESGESKGSVSIKNMFDGNDFAKKVDEVELENLANLIVRGGWPESLNLKEKDYSIVAKSYIENILDFDIDEDDKKRSKDKMKMLLNSLSRNESTISTNKLLIKDIEENETNNDMLASRTTLDDYLDVLNRLYLTENQEAYNLNYRSPERVGKSVKRHLADPSLACACLNLNKEKLMKDLNTFGFLFEALVERDLRIYMEYLDGKIYHFRDNVSGLEIDSILEFDDGEYAAVEIKLGYNEVEEATKNLQTFYDNMVKKPKFMCVIVGVCPSAYRDPKTGIYVVPITELKP